MVTAPWLGLCTCRFLMPRESSLLFYWKQNWKSQMNAFGHGLRCEDSLQFLSRHYQPHQHACMQITAWGSGSAAQECCSFPVHRSSNLSLLCSLGIKPSVHWQQLWLHTPVKKRCSYGVILCVSQIPMACRVIRVIILAAYPPGEALVGCEFFWCVFSLAGR